MHSRYEIYFEQYVKTVNVEAKLTQKIAKTKILPAAIRYQRELAESANIVKAAGATPDATLLGAVSKLVGELGSAITKLESAMAHESSDVVAESTYFRDTLLPTMLEVRAAADALEGVVADDLWPLPTYQEMLFIK